MQVSSKKTTASFFLFILSVNLIFAQTELYISAKSDIRLPYRTFKTETLNQLKLDKTESIAQNKYGSRADKKGKRVTGFFHTEYINKRWWIVDPEGFLSIIRGVNAVAPGESQFSAESYKNIYQEDVKNWLSKTQLLLNEYGFNAYGAWSKPAELIAQTSFTETSYFSYTPILNLMSNYGAGRTVDGVGHKDYPHDCIFIFEKGFEKFCDREAAKLIKYKDDSKLFGYFTDNELPFSKKSLTNFLALGREDTTNINYKTTKKWLADNGYTEADTLSLDVRYKFLSFVAERYFSVVYQAIKKYDPNHLVLGARIHLPESRDNKWFMQTMGKYVDVVSVNYYGEWTPDLNSVTMWGKNASKPFIVTEFYTKAEDTGLNNAQGAGWIVKTQTDRGAEYQNFLMPLIQSGNCVGWHWFKYMDDPDVSKNYSSNKGLVNVKYEPYTDMLRFMQQFNSQIYQLADYFDTK